MFIQTIRKTGAFNVKNLGADNSPNNKIGNKGIDDAPLFPGAAEQEVDGDHLHHLDVSVVFRVDDAVFYFADGQVVRYRV